MSDKDLFSPLRARRTALSCLSFLAVERFKSRFLSNSLSNPYYSCKYAQCFRNVDVRRFFSVFSLVAHTFDLANF